MSVSNLSTFLTGRAVCVCLDQDERTVDVTCCVVVNSHKDVCLKNASQLSFDTNLDLEFMKVAFVGDRGQVNARFRTTVRIYEGIGRSLESGHVVTKRLLPDISDYMAALFEGRVPEESNCLRFATSSAFSSLATERHASGCLTVRKVPYADNAMGYYIRLHSVAAVHESTKLHGELRSYWASNGFHEPKAFIEK